MKKIFILLFLITFQLTWASERDVIQVFHQKYYTSYESGKCGRNILEFLRNASSFEQDLTDAKIIEITNEGFSVMGLVNAVFAREAGMMNPKFPQEGLRRLPGSKNWYHHVVLLNKGKIYDFDFGNTPSVLTVKDYFEKMFLSDANPRDSYFSVTRKDKLQDYKLTLRPALATLQVYDKNKENPKGEEIKLGDFLKYISQ